MVKKRKFSVMNTLIATCVVTAIWNLSSNRIFGFRGSEDVYNFSYRGEPAAVVRKDARFAPDRYFIRLGHGEEVLGKIVSDSGELVETTRKIWVNFLTRDSGYSIDTDYRFTRID